MNYLLDDSKLARFSPWEKILQSALLSNYVSKKSADQSCSNIFPSRSLGINNSMLNVLYILVYILALIKLLFAEETIIFSSLGLFLENIRAVKIG